MSTPFRDNERPPGPPPPPTFSPLRPMRMFLRALGSALWWWLTTPSWNSSAYVDHLGVRRVNNEPTGLGCLGFIMGVLCVISTVVFYFQPAIPPRAVYIFGTLTLLRAWLPAAMHLDEPESREWWREKLS